MPFINHHTKEINCKIVYCGCGMSGKTTNLQFIFDHTSADEKGKLMRISRENERTMFFDFLPMDAGEIGGFRTRFHLYSIPGQSLFEASSRILLKGVDGIVFVVDSQRERSEENLKSYESFKKNIEFQGYEIEKLPLVLQYNKRDLPNVLSVPELSRDYNSRGLTEFEAVASQGLGVIETLSEITKLVIANLRGVSAI